MKNQKVESLFANWEEAMIWSCLQGHMGTLTLEDEKNPVSAMIDIGDFCFLAGRPDVGLLNKIKGSKLLVPGDEAWERLIQQFFEQRVNKRLRYAIKKEPDVFDIEKLHGYVTKLPDGYVMKLFDEEAFQQAEREPWSADLCSQFRDYLDYESRAVGVAIMYQGELVAGASPYAVYDGGIEIEIDTKPKYRRKGLATVCGARLILECLKRNLYPSWDAHDLRSVALAEKLGYHRSHSYVTYDLKQN